MSTTCAFSNGFDSGFDICVAVAEEEDPTQQGGSGTGAGALTTRRLRRRTRKLVALEGFGHLALPIGVGDLSADAALAGRGDVGLAGSGQLSREQALAADAVLGSITGDGNLAAASAVSASAAIELAGDAIIGTAAALAASAEIPALFAPGPALSASAALAAEAVLDVELAAIDATVSASQALEAVADLDVGPVGAGAITAHAALAGAGPLVLHGIGDLSVDDDGTAVFLLLGVPDV